jgi:4-diphosphocytidyl-2-C-methyl-D-erythritol kinase
MTSPGRIYIRAYAKINLTLEVLHRRPDQYHEVRSVVQTVSLADEITVQPNAPGTMLRVSGYPVPGGDDNLVMAAIRQVSSRLGISRDLEVSLRKLIPPGRGLAGGSSDAAAVLRALGCLHEWQIDRSTLNSIAAELGSDVPLFLKGGTMLVEGRGEIVRRLAGPMPEFSLVLTWPQVSVPTEAAYGLLRPEDFTTGEATARLWEALGRGDTPRSESLVNCFERAVFSHWPEVRALHERLGELAGARAHMTGSGSALFVLTDQAEALAERLRAEGYEARAVRPVPCAQELSCSILGEDRQGICLRREGQGDG